MTAAGLVPVTLELMDAVRSARSTTSTSWAWTATPARC